MLCTLAQRVGAAEEHFRSMPPTIVVRSADADSKRQREATARRVVSHFGDALPALRLLCFFDDQEWQALRQPPGPGPANRGLYTPMGTPDPLAWAVYPRSLQERLFVNGESMFDHLIYLHGSTCADEAGLTMTLAHELQHFIQRAITPTFWAASTLIPRLSGCTVDALGLKWCHVPHEREARIVSKRVAENLLGPEIRSEERRVGKEC